MTLFDKTTSQVVLNKPLGIKIHFINSVNLLSVVELFIVFYSIFVAEYCLYYFLLIVVSVKHFYSFMYSILHVS